MIKTPPGHARKSQKLLKTMLLPKFKKIELRTYISKKDDTILWLINAPIKHIVAINRKVAMYDIVIQTIFNSRTAKKAIKKLADNPDDINIVKAMLEKHTTVEIIKEKIDMTIFEQV